LRYCSSRAQLKGQAPWAGNYPRDARARLVRPASRHRDFL
jgi:hypothetical protein